MNWLLAPPLKNLNSFFGKVKFMESLIPEWIKMIFRNWTKLVFNLIWSSIDGGTGQPTR